MISFGVETGSDEGLKLIQKNTTIAKIKEVFAWCRQLGILSIADYMIGFPFEKDEDAVCKNIDFLIELDPDYAQISVLSLYPNTALFNQAADKGLLNSARWREFAQNPKKGFFVDHWEEHLSTVTQVELQKQAYRRFYLRPRYILRSLWRLRSYYELKAKLRGFLTLFR